MKSLIFLAAILLSLASPASPTDLSNAGHLRKLSLHLRGVTPVPAEYAELQKLQKDTDIAAFFQRKADEYLNSAQARDRMVFRLSEKFQVETPAIDMNAYLSTDVSQRKYVTGIRQDSISDLFYRISSQNLSWDYLLTGKDYNLYPKNAFFDFGDINDFDFFRTVKPDLPENPSDFFLETTLADPMGVHFAADDLTVSGVLTTPRFLSRYNTTNVNKNRRRAAAVFRIFMCDPMFPIIPPPPDKKTADLPNAFDDIHGGATVTEQQLTAAMQVSSDARHGADPNCAACHVKLDPMGRTFQNIGVALNPEPARGALHFTKSDGTIFDQGLSGIGELGGQVAKQSEYLNCQIKWFWKEFIGVDVALSTDRENQLVEQFNKLSRKTNDFIKFLVSQPEFTKEPAKIQIISFDRVRPLLQRCDSCHSGGVDVPAFAGGVIDKTTLLKMRHRVNLPDSDHHRMPRDWARWDPKDLDAVKQWIEQGAVSPSGSIQLSPNDLAGAK